MIPVLASLNNLRGALSTCCADLNGLVTLCSLAHSLGVAHLAKSFSQHLRNTQRDELDITLRDIELLELAGGGFTLEGISRNTIGHAIVPRLVACTARQGCVVLVQGWLMTWGMAHFHTILSDCYGAGVCLTGTLLKP